MTPPTGGAAAAGVGRPSFADASRALLRETVLDAVGDLLGDRSWPDVPLAAVAKAAGVSRQTLYNEFGSRQELARAYVLREVDRFLAAVEAVAAEHDEPRAALAAAFDLFLTTAGSHPLFRAIVTGDGADDLLRFVTVDGRPVLERATDRLAAFFSERWGVTASDARLVAESVVRLAISHAALPSGPAPLTAAAVARLLGPFVDELLRR